jgi:hypothetical protein
MSRLVQLYPRAWRDRYEDEFRALLAERPLSPGDIVDTLRGAVDAHLHPQGNVAPQPWTHRLPGLLALGGGLVWTAAAVLVAVDATNGAWSIDGIAMILMFSSLPGDYMMFHGRRIALGLAVIGLCALLFNILPWPGALLAILVAYVVALGGMLTLAAIRAGIGPRERRSLLVVTIALQVAATMPFAMGSVTITGMWAVVGTLANFVPFGLAWALVGLRLAIRGAPTIIDPPVSPIEPEVSAA